MSKNVGIILAAGKGLRIGAELPKQFLKIGGKTILEHCVDVFERHPEMDEIVVVAHPDWHDEIERMRSENAWTKLRRIIAGGKERFDSSFNAILAYSDQPDANLLIHDAARPLVSQRIISEVIRSLEQFKAVDVAIPSKDTVILTNRERNRIVEEPPRSQAMLVQTPQGFKQSTIEQAYRLGQKDAGFLPTDDCGVVLRYLPEEAIHIVSGDENNIKITYPDDLAFAERFLKQTALIS